MQGHNRCRRNGRIRNCNAGLKAALAEALTFSSIKSPAGNIEFLADVRPGPGAEITDERIAVLVEQAHREL